MAVDTALKRASAINVSSPWRGILPLPDGSVDAEDRQVVPFHYSGILADDSGPVVAAVDEWIIRARRRGRR